MLEALPAVLAAGVVGIDSHISESKARSWWTLWPRGMSIRSRWTRYPGYYVRRPSTHSGWISLSSSRDLFPHRMFYVYDSHIANTIDHKVVLEDTYHLGPYMTSQGTTAGYFRLSYN